MNFIKYLIYSSIILSTEEILLVNWLSLNILNVPYILWLMSLIWL